MGNMIKRCTAAPEAKPVVQKKSRIAFGEKLTRNVLVASLLLACVVGARDVMLSPEKNVLSVLQNAVESEWDENLGRLVYANSTLSQAITVFSAQNQQSLYQPCSSQVADVFSDASPYIVYQPAQSVLSAAACEITGVSYTPELGYTVRAYCDNALECLYSGLSACFVSEGDVLPALAQIGSCAENELVFEVRQNGTPVDASVLFIPQQVQ